MEEAKFLGVNRGNLMIVGVIVAICAPALTMIATVIGLFTMMNSSINRLDANITALRAEVAMHGEQLAAQGAAIDALTSETKQAPRRRRRA